MNVSFEKSTGHDEWLTPPVIIEKCGKFDLDPCSPIIRPWDTANNHYCKTDDGLNKEWEGRVWCNPPYGKEAEAWLKKASQHNNTIVLIFARTETRSFFNYVWDKADALFFIKGRLNFHKVDGSKGGTAGSPSVLVAYGENNAIILKNIDMDGKFISLK